MSSALTNSLKTGVFFCVGCNRPKTNKRWTLDKVTGSRKCNTCYHRNHTAEISRNEKACCMICKLTETTHWYGKKGSRKCNTCYHRNFTDKISRNEKACCTICKLTETTHWYGKKGARKCEFCYHRNLIAEISRNEKACCTICTLTETTHWYGEKGARKCQICYKGTRPADIPPEEKPSCLKCNTITSDQWHGRIPGARKCEKCFYECFKPKALRRAAKARATSIFAQQHPNRQQAGPAETAQNPDIQQSLASTSEGWDKHHEDFLNSYLNPDIQQSLVSTSEGWDEHHEDFLNSYLNPNTQQAGSTETVQNYLGTPNQAPYSPQKPDREEYYEGYT